MQTIYRLMQIAIVLGTVVLFTLQHPETPPLAAAIIGLTLAAIATATIYWTGVGLARLSGRNGRRLGPRPK